MKHSENIEDESEEMQQTKLFRHRSLVVPLFPMRKKPSTELSKISFCSSQSTRIISEYRSMPNSCQKRELESLIIKGLANEMSSKKYLVNSRWSEKYSVYLYQNGPRPGQINNTDIRESIIVNEQVWRFLMEEYQGGPEISEGMELKYNQVRHSDKRSRTIEPVISKTVEVAKNNLEMPLIGMKNESYYCYMHAGLQCLLSFADLNFYILKSVKTMVKSFHSKRVLSLVQFNRAYLELLEQIKGSNQAVRVNALKFLLINKFHPKNQHDCHELILYLLGQLEDEINNLNKEIKAKKLIYYNFIDYLFKGKLQIQIICSGCKQIVKLSEPFITLSLAITNAKTLEQCLDEYFKEELLKDYKCTKCGGTCTKCTKLGDLPKILILHLKRFQYFPSCHKNNKPIQYPMDVLQIKNSNYRLKSVIMHTGNLQSGHYYCYCKRYHQWFRFNDDQVSQVTKREVLNQMAYVLFYQLNEQC